MRAHLQKRFEPAAGTGAFVFELEEGTLAFKASDLRHPDHATAL